MVEEQDCGQNMFEEAPQALPSVGLLMITRVQEAYGGGGGIKGTSVYTTACEPVWPSGKALGWKAEGLRFESASALLSLQKLWSVDTVL